MGDLSDEEFLKQRAGGSPGEAEKRVFKGEADSAIAGGVVGIGDSGGGKGAQHVGIVRLPAAVVALGDEDSGDGVEGA